MPVPSGLQEFLEGFAFAAAVYDLPAAHESRLREDPQHAPVVEIGVDAEGPDSAFAGELFRLFQEFPPDSVPQRFVGHGQPVHDHIVAPGEPRSVEGLVGGFPIEDNRTVGDDRRLPGRSLPGDHMAVSVFQVVVDIPGGGVSVLPLKASGGGHAALGLADDLQDARDVGRGCRPKKGLFHGRSLRVRHSGKVPPRLLGGPIPGTKVRKDRRMSSCLHERLTFCHNLSRNVGICDKQ